MRNRVTAADDQARRAHARFPQAALDRPHDEVRSVQRHLALTLALDLDDESRFRCLDHDLVIETHGEPHAVEAGTEVGAGRCHHSGGRQGGRQGAGHGRQTYTRPSLATTATGSTGTGMTAGIPFSAVSGSLRPLPVTVHTTVEPLATQPSSTDLSNPAMLAADAGSTNTPSARATRW